MSHKESRYREIQYGRQAGILKVKFDNQSQTKAKALKPTNPILLPGGYFESDIAENQ